MLARWSPIALAVAAVLASGTAPAVAATPACSAALEALKAEEDAAIAARQAVQRGRGAATGASAADRTLPRQLQALRREAAAACLGGSVDAPPPPLPQSARPPIVIPLPAPTLPSSPSLPPPPIQRPLDNGLRILGCDAQGCWGSDGSRLLRSGSHFIGPRGLCFSDGATLRCP